MIISDLRLATSESTTYPRMSSSHYDLRSRANEAGDVVTNAAGAVDFVYPGELNENTLISLLVARR